MRPSATAAAFLPSSVVTSAISPVAILAIRTALRFVSAWRFSPFGPVGILIQLRLLGGKHSRMPLAKRGAINGNGSDGITEVQDRKVGSDHCSSHCGSFWRHWH